MIAATGAPDHAARRRRATAELSGAGVDALLVTAPPNVRYLTGFTGTNGTVLLATAERCVLLTDDRYEQRAHEEAPGVTVRTGGSWEQAVRAAAVELGVRRLGFEGEHLPHTRALELLTALDAHDLAGTSVAGVVEGLRSAKDAHEQELLRRACTITTTALDELFGALAPGIAEREVAVRLERRFIDLGAEDRAFPTIVASGPNGAVPHHRAGGRTLQAGDLVTVDCGARVDGYHADCTRTVALGEPDPDLREVHGVVLAAQAAGREAAVSGAEAAAVDRAARTVIEDAGHGDAFLHPTGHGVGLEIHEQPILAARTAATLPAGATITVEPGIYLAGRGGVRIEDTVLVRAEGPPEVLTDLSRDLLVL